MVKLASCQQICMKCHIGKLSGVVRFGMGAAISFPLEWQLIIRVSWATVIEPCCRFYKPRWSCLGGYLGVGSKTADWTGVRVALEEDTGLICCMSAKTWLPAFC